MKRSPYQKRGNSAVVVIDAFELRRAGVASLLKPWAEDGGMRIVEFDPHTALPAPDADADAPVRLILLIIGGSGVADPEPQAWIRSLAGTYGDVPLVVMSDREDASEIVAALEAGVRGFIPASTQLSVAIQALTFIMSGGAFFPPAALTRAAQAGQGQRSSIAVVTTMVDNSALTARQRQVLEQLQQGASNKVIGRRLKLRESTVKVHIRHIMRKLGAVNRTQAALSAVHLRVSTAAPHAVPGSDEGEGKDEEPESDRASRPPRAVVHVTTASLVRPTLVPSGATSPA